MTMPAGIVLQSFALGGLAAVLLACSASTPAGPTGAGGGVSTEGGAGAAGASSNSCDEQGGCAAGSVCVVGNMCAPVKSGACGSDSDCGSDSYCCGPDCLRDASAPAVCIPYGYGPRGNVNASCRAKSSTGSVFSPAVQCEWSGPKPTDPFPDSANVLATPLVADLPNDSQMAAEIVVITYNGDDGTVNPTVAPEKYGVIRIINGQTCELEETVADPAYPLRASAAPALADLDQDGKIDIVARRNDQGLIAFSWDDKLRRFVKKWTADGMDITAQQAWDGPSVFDLDDDGSPEILLRGAVYDGRTGEPFYDGTLVDTVPPRPFNGLIPVVGELNADGLPKLVATVNNEITFFGWHDKAWVDEGVLYGAHFGAMASHFGVADFGTPGQSAGAFDFKNLDGVAEIVGVDDETGTITIHTIRDHQVVMRVTTGDRGGSPVIGDFDSDGLPEIGVAGKTRFRVFDFDCKDGGAGCESPYVRWSQPSQDGSSAQTSAAIFDFDGDGRAEAVYADECFLRVYEGHSGTVLYSAYRTSATWYENPLVADVDRDDSTEIVVNSNKVGIACPTSSARGTPYVDPIHPGVRCDDDGGCLAGSHCVDKLCRCADNSQCASGTTCVAPLLGTAGAGNVCRATHPNSQQQSGIRVLRDRLDRWASSRPLWNQHAYSITNIDDNGKVPRTSSWLQNWRVKGLNNYRQNVQGIVAASDYPDLTASLRETEACTAAKGVATIAGTVCNRGKKAVGATLPASFYQGDPAANQILCTTYTREPLPTGGCMRVSCGVAGVVSGSISMVVNDDGKGGHTTVECNSDNNRDAIVISACNARPN